MAKYKVEVDKEKCISCGICMSTCPNEFHFVDGKSHPINEITEDECVLEAEKNCPVHAIKVTKIEE